MIIHWVRIWLSTEYEYDYPLSMNMIIHWVKYEYPLSKNMIIHWVRIWLSTEYEYDYPLSMNMIIRWVWIWLSTE